MAITYSESVRASLDHGDDVVLVGETRAIKDSLTRLTRTFGGHWSPTRGAWILTARAMAAVAKGENLGHPEVWVRRAIESGAVRVEAE